MSDDLFVADSQSDLVSAVATFVAGKNSCNNGVLIIQIISQTDLFVSKSDRACGSVPGLQTAQPVETRLF